VQNKVKKILTAKKMKRVVIALSLEANNNKQIVKVTSFPSLKEKRAKMVNLKPRVKETTRRVVTATWKGKKVAKMKVIEKPHNLRKDKKEEKEVLS
jgi:hypothetical protein